MPIHDSSAVTYLVHPEYFETVQHPIKVETLGISRGKTWMGIGISDNEEGFGERLKPWENRTRLTPAQPRNRTHLGVLLMGHEP